MASQPALFNRTYEEALDMIIEARNYMTHVKPRDRQMPDGLPDLHFSCEALRVTSRLTQVMAWLMMQRAVQHGELSMEEALCEGNRISCQDICLDNAANDDETLPTGLRSLLDRSFRLYERVSRLERMVITRTGPLN